jgi:SAM-dependent methyltransferase
MNHQDHVNLLRSGVPAHVASTASKGQQAQTPADTIWADLGSGAGAFTLALADLLGSGATIYSVDRDAGALAEQRRALESRFPGTAVHYLTANFTHSLDLPPLDGVVMANALHFLPYRDQPALVRRLRNYLRPGGRLILVEYNADQGNSWVPYPLTYGQWERLARQSGFTETCLLATVPSRFLREIYAALSC